jgi:hypothetical protein
MGKQIVFYAIEQDYSDLLTFLQDNGLRALPEIIQTDTEIESVLLDQFRIPDSQEFFYLLPDTLSDTEAIYVEMAKNPSLSKLTTYGSPVIEFVPCKYRNNQVYEGRFYWELDSNDRFYPIILKKYNKIVRYIRKWEQTDQFGFYVAPHTANLAKKEKIHLMHHQIELKVA